MARTRLRFILGLSLWLVAQSGSAAITPPLSQPSWKQLSTEQQRILAPLSGEWDQMEGFRRKKWLGIAQRYQSLSPDEQARMQRRMTTWAKLTPQERKLARDQYLSLQKASPETKEAVKMKWQEYKELPEADKARLKAEAANRPTPRPAPAKPVAPAAAQAKPVAATASQGKPVTTPASPQSPTPGPTIAR
jgi:hypothetical protein